MSSAVRVSTEEPFQPELQINAEVGSGWENAAEGQTDAQGKRKRASGLGGTQQRWWPQSQSQSWSWKVSRVIVGLLEFLLFFAKMYLRFTPSFSSYFSG